MTAREYALVEYLARRAGWVVGRAEIAEHVWDENYDPFSNVIEVYVRRLRRSWTRPAGVADPHAARRRIRARDASRARVSLTIRARLALWYAAVLGLVLAGSGLASYYGYSRARLAQLDEQLSRADALAAGAMNTELAEGLPLAEAAHDALEDLELPGRGLAIFSPDGTHLLVPGRVCRK